MKKLLAGVVVVLAASAVAVGVASGSGGGGTVIDEGFACSIFDGNGNLFTTNNSQVILYVNQQSAKAVERCWGDGAPAATLTYFNYGNTGLPCGIEGSLTTDWSNKVGRNGNSQLTCTLDLTDAGRAASSSGHAGIG